MAENPEPAVGPPPNEYEPKPTLQYTSIIGLQAAGVGAFVSAIQNALGTHTRGAAGFFTRSGGTIGIFGAMGATFAFTEAAIANQREKDDALNGAAGACAAGFLAGVRARSLPMAVASCAVMGTAMGAFDYGGKSLQGVPETQEERRRRFFKHPPRSPFPVPSTESE
ncbi:hypothetical protein BKA93DRAFT_814267 [Sparassis latifolia]|uniref:Uncharacterized protein n=1 Tax=Sparassis crispa TaxID=139825 RepID=A0A401G759_9APHY|nr:hypothetical protein SCP_0108930 [Sparassis crispa]GBE78011.1 hypothetical protein SCP_0108930 [Sparassis crispa]